MCKLLVLHSFLAGLVLVCIGCGTKPTPTTKTKSIGYRLEINAGNLTLTVGDLTIEFEGLGKEEVGDGPLAVGSWAVAEPASGSGGIDPWPDFKYSYRHGRVDFSVDDYEFTVVDEGTKLTYGGQSFVIGNGATTIRIGQDGTVQVVESE